MQSRIGMHDRRKEKYLSIRKLLRKLYHGFDRSEIIADMQLITSRLKSGKNPFFHQMKIEG